jgi:integrase/recombinase XerC
MREAIATFLAERKAEGISNTTLKNFQMRLERLRKFIVRRGVTRWAHVTPQHMDQFRAEGSRAGLAAGTQSAYLMSCRVFLRWLLRRGRILSDPCRSIIVSRTEEPPLPEPPLSEEEVQAFLARLPRRHVRDLRNIAHFELLYSAGLRLSESLALNVEDLDFPNKVLHVRNGKGGKARDIPMMRGLVAALKDYLCLRRSLLKGPDNGVLLLSIRGKRLTEVGFRTLMATINKHRPPESRRVHAHLFRHSIAVHLLRGGADIRHIQAFLGHESLDTTKIYLRLVPADLRKSYDAAMPDFAVTA